MPDGDPTPPINPPTPEPPANPPAQFTQAQLDAIIADRLAREAKKYEGFDDLKAKAAKFDELEAQNLGEVERLTRERDEWKAKGEQALAAAQKAAVRSAVVTESVRANVVDPDAVLALLPDGSVTVGDDGQVTGVAEAVKALLDAKPYLVGQPAPAPRVPNGKRGEPGSGLITSRAQLKSMKPEEIWQAQQEGRIQITDG